MEFVLVLVRNLRVASTSTGCTSAFAEIVNSTVMPKYENTYFSLGGLLQRRKMKRAFPISYVRSQFLFQIANPSCLGLLIAEL